MASKKILALSSSRIGNSGFLEKSALVINKFIGSKATNIAFIPFADANKKYEEYGVAVKEGLRNSAIEINVVFPENATSVVEKADAILVGGGNTFKLLHDLYELDLLNKIRDKVNGGTAYIGWSAGSNILAPTISTTNDMPVIEPKSFKALGLFPFQINPHYFNKKVKEFNSETRDQRLEEYLKMNREISIVALPEGSYLKMENNLLKYFGDEAGVLFKSENNEKGFIKATINSEENISFLL